MNIRHIIYIACLMLFCGCSDVKLPTSEPVLVIDGWIENGKNPIVIVTSSVPVRDTLGSDEDLKKYVVTWTKVTVSDGEREVVLTGMVNDDYYPPYIYTTSYIKGEAGKTYTLKVEEYQGRSVSAVTTIPEPVPLESIKVMKSKSTVDGYYLTGALRDNPKTKDYYKVFIKKSRKDSTYVPSFLGLIDDEILNNEVDEIPINNAVNILNEDQSSLFSADDYIFVRFSTIDENAYKYWSDFDNITMAQNPLFPATSKIRSNINGGLGHWSGYGSTTYRVSIADSLARNRVW